MFMRLFQNQSPRRSGHPATWVVLIGSIALSGCGAGGSLTSATAYPVKGKVLLASGKPLTAGKVIFLPKSGSGMASIGEIGADGTFSLRTADGSEGAPAGEYIVTINWPGTPLMKSSDPDEDAVTPDRLRNAYSRLSTSKLRATVREKDNTIDFSLP